MKLQDLKVFLTTCLLQGVEFPTEPKLKFEIDDYDEVVPEEYRGILDAEFNHREGDKFASVLIVPSFVMKALDKVELDYKQILEGDNGIAKIFAERVRQLEEEGYSKYNDVGNHLTGALAKAAATYALRPFLNEPNFAFGDLDGVPVMFPFGRSWWKPTPDNRIKELAKAGALIAAEIDRLAENEKNTNDENK